MLRVQSTRKVLAVSTGGVLYKVWHLNVLVSKVLAVRSYSTNLVTLMAAMFITCIYIMLFVSKKLVL